MPWGLEVFLQWSGLGRDWVQQTGPGGALLGGPSRQGKTANPQGRNHRARRAPVQPGLTGRKPRPQQRRNCLISPVARSAFHHSEAGGAAGEEQVPPQTQPSSVIRALQVTLPLYTSLSLLRRGQASSTQGACQRACGKQVEAWKESGYVAGPLAQGFVPPGEGKGGSDPPGSHSTDPSLAGAHSLWAVDGEAVLLLLNPEPLSVL